MFFDFFVQIFYEGVLDKGGKRLLKCMAEKSKAIVPLPHVAHMITQWDTQESAS